jgi:PAS domain-containing protein
MYNDIRKETQFLNDLKKQKALFEQLFHNFPDAIILLNENREIIHSNESFRHLFQYSQDEINSEPLPLNKKQYLEGASFAILRQPNC